ncbi:MAG: DUF192 domain-containing protein [Synechococcaceae cyanobacterium SM2_3_2]|nr:DUF192 domain-containing protein [Synechococcaceae cyanobacterium SM2_3_2]
MVWGQVLKPSVWILSSLALCLCWSCAADVGNALTESQTQDSPAETLETEVRGQQLPLVAQATIGDYKFLLEAAVTPQQQAMGLMFREEVAPDRGMIFPYDPPVPRVSYWMFNVPISLDIIFIAGDEVVHIADNVPPCTSPPSACPTYGPGPGTPPINVVLELAGGRSEEIGLTVGGKVVIEPLDSPLPHDFRE